MTDEKQEKTKIIVDDDWKAQAQAEKQRLAKEVEAGAAAGGPGADTAGRPGQLPSASFATLVDSLVTQTLLALGGYEDPKSKKRYVDLDLAKFHIDSLAILEEKTRGNLTAEEKKLLDQALYETRMSYVQIAQAASRF